MNRSAELCVGHGREQRHQAVEEEDDQKGGPGDTGRDTREDEDPGADHGADADHRDIDEPHLAAQADLYGHAPVPTCAGQ